MKYTTNYNFSQPEPLDAVNASKEYADNMGAIDEAIHENAELIDALNTGVANLGHTVALVNQKADDLESSKLDKSGGTMTGPLDMNGGTIRNVGQLTGDQAKTVFGGFDLQGAYQIHGLAEPEDDDDAATKEYVDNAAGGRGFLKIDGSNAMTGDLNMDGNAINMGQDNKITYVGNNQIRVNHNLDVSGKVTSGDIECSKINAHNTLNMHEKDIEGVNGLSVTNIGSNRLVNVIFQSSIDMHNHDIEGATSIASGSIAVDHLESKTSNLDIELGTNLNANEHRIVGLLAPNSDMEAANKAYVDALKPLVIRATNQGGSTWAFDKTAAQIIAAGMNSVVHIIDGTYTYVAHLTYFSHLGTNQYDIGWNVSYGTNGVNGYDIYLNYDGVHIEHWVD